MELPTTVTGLLVGAGLLLIVSSLFGGGLEVKELKIPHISKGMRALSFAVGVVLVALAILPGMIPERGPGSTQVADEPLSVTAGGEESPESPPELGGQDPQQSSSAGASPDIANSTLRFRAEHTATNSDETAVAVIEFQIRKITPPGGTEEIGEFELTRMNLTPPNEAMDEIRDALLGSPGYVPLGSMQDLDLETSWEALAEYAQDLNEQVALQQVGNEEGGFEALGPAILMVFLIIEVEFDVRSIFTAPLEGVADGRPMDIQVGTDMQSTIRLEGPPSTVAAGEELSYRVIRRAPDAAEFDAVGRANYSTRDGQLISLDARFFAGSSDSRDIFYKVEIERL